MHEDILILHHFYHDTDENDEKGFLDALEFFDDLIKGMKQFTEFEQVDFKVGNTDILPFGTNRGFLVMGGKVGTFQNGK